MRTFILLLLALFTLPPHSKAAKLSLVGLANNSEPSSPGASYSGVPALGGGALLEFRFLPMIGLELGALYAPRKFEITTLTPIAAKVTFESKVYEFPALLRFHLGHVLSFGVGAYYARTDGNIKVTTEAAGSVSTVDHSPASLDQTTTDHGIVTSLALAFRLMPFTRILFDGRYTIGLKNNSTTSGGDRKFNDMQILAGLQFSF